MYHVPQVNPRVSIDFHDKLNLLAVISHPQIGIENRESEICKTVDMDRNEDILVNTILFLQGTELPFLCSNDKHVSHLLSINDHSLLYVLPD